MRNSSPPRSAAPADTTFAQQAAEGRPGAVGELVAFIRENTKWWLTPIMIVLLLLGALLLFAGTAAAPFIYTLF